MFKYKNVSYNEKVTSSNLHDVFKSLYRKLDKEKSGEGNNNFEGLLTALYRRMTVDDPNNGVDFKRAYGIVKGYDKKGYPKCVICGKGTEFNYEKKKYERLCGSPKCTDEYIKSFRSNMKRTFGVETGMQSIKIQETMLKSRGIAKEYVHSDGTFITVIGSVEYDIIETLDKECGIKSDDVAVPGPTIKYRLPGDEKDYYHISDFYIKSLDLIISGKDGLENPNMHPGFAKGRIKNIYQYMSILKNTTHNFIQVEGKGDLSDLKDVIQNVKKHKGSRFIIPPRIDLMFAESLSNVLEDDTYSQDDTLRYIVITDLEGNILNTYFSQNMMDGFTKLGDGFGFVNFYEFVKSNMFNVYMVNITEANGVTFIDFLRDIVSPGMYKDADMFQIAYYVLNECVDDSIVDIVNISQLEEYLKNVGVYQSIGTTTPTLFSGFDNLNIDGTDIKIKLKYREIMKNSDNGEVFSGCISYNIDNDSSFVKLYFKVHDLVVSVDINTRKVEIVSFVDVKSDMENSENIHLNPMSEALAKFIYTAMYRIHKHGYTIDPKPFLIYNNVNINARMAMALNSVVQFDTVFYHTIADTLGITTDYDIGNFIAEHISKVSDVINTYDEDVVSVKLETFGDYDNNTFNNITRHIDTFKGF